MPFPEHRELEEDSDSISEFGFAIDIGRTDEGHNLNNSQARLEEE